jgi:hypothetical protein
MPARGAGRLVGASRQLCFAPGSSRAPLFLGSNVSAASRCSLDKGAKPGSWPFPRPLASSADSSPRAPGATADADPCRGMLRQACELWPSSAGAVAANSDRRSQPGHGAVPASAEGPDPASPARSKSDAARRIERSMGEWPSATRPHPTLGVSPIQLSVPTGRDPGDARNSGDRGPCRGFSRARGRREFAAAGGFASWSAPRTVHSVPAPRDRSAQPLKQRQPSRSGRRPESGDQDARDLQRDYGWL